jgi:hypothetical protein
MRFAASVERPATGLRARFTAHHPLTVNECELVKKIAHAMNLKDSVYVIDTFYNQQGLSSFTIFLGNTPPNLVCTRGVLTPISSDTFAMLTDHPSQLLKDPTRKRAVWQDMQIVMQHLNS